MAEPPIDLTRLVPTTTSLYCTTGTVHPPEAFADPPVYVGDKEKPNTTVKSGGHVISTSGTGVVVAPALVLVVVVLASVVVVVPLVLVVVGPVVVGGNVRGTTSSLRTVGGWMLSASVNEITTAEKSKKANAQRSV